MSDVQSGLLGKFRLAFSTSELRPGDLPINMPGRAIVRSFLWWLMTIGFLCQPVGTLCRLLVDSVLKGNSTIRDLSIALPNLNFLILLTIYPGTLLLLMKLSLGTPKVPPSTSFIRRVNVE
jgi:hypothetical protein